MKILVVEDRPENIAAAKKMLSAHELTIVSGYDPAHEALTSQYLGNGKFSTIDFDVVLTDVMFPKGGNECMSDEGSALVRRQGNMPYGPVVALRALSVGIRRIGVITQGNHHDDPFVFAFDNLPGFTAGDVKVVCTNRMSTDEEPVDAKTLEPHKLIEWSQENKAAYDEQCRRLDAGELVFVKDWAKLLDAVLSNGQPDDAPKSPTD